MTKTRTLKAIRAEIKAHGYKFQSILGFGNNSKTIKSDLASDYLTAIAYLQPNYSTCTFSKMAKCDVACLNTAGRGGMNNVQRVRHDRTKCYYEHPELFMELLHVEINQHIRRCKKSSRLCAIRLNGTSDLDWSAVAKRYPQVQFYDYTKDLGRVRKWIEMDAEPRSFGSALIRRHRQRPSNYHVTLSWSGASKVYMKRCLELMDLDPQLNVAMVFRDNSTVQSLIGKTLFGRTVIDGDKTDLRFLDPASCIVALWAKGGAKHDDTGFVVDVAKTPSTNRNIILQNTSL
jgi:hypothetical protein